MIKKFTTLVLVLLLCTTAFAGVTGKIAGYVTDAATGDPLPGVNVLIDGSTMGAATDLEGFYVILNVPPGEYTLKAMFVGYNTVEFEGVKVSIDFTTNIDIPMSETTLETGEVITVVADRPLIRKDEVSTRHIISSEEIEIQPVTSFQEVARNQAGVVGNHFRGGRTGEVLVVIDGIPVRDPAGQYVGDLGGFTTDIPEYGIQEMEVSLGGFGAEYGNVQSGLLNLALKEGSQKLAGRLRFTNQGSFGMEKSFTENGVTFNRRAPLLNIYELNVNGPLYSNKLTFSLSGEVTDQQQGLYINQESFEQTYQGKMTYKFSPQHRLSVGGLFSNREWDTFYFPASKYGPGPGYQTDEYSFLPEGSDTLNVYRYVSNEDLFGTTTTEQTPGQVYSEGDTFNVTQTRYMAGMQEYLWDREKNSNMAYVVWKHTLSDRTFYEVRLNSFYSNYHYATPDVEDRDGDGDRDEDLQWDISKPGPHPIFRDREENYWWTIGDDPGFRDQKSWNNTLKIDMVSQVNKNHLLKGGIETSLNRTKVENISWTLGVGLYRKDIWDQDYFDFAAYIQDKLEFEGVIALIGLRFDAFNPNGLGDDITYPGDYANPYSNVVDGIPEFINPQKPEMKYQLSPRIGISHPITNESILHFTYGHYFQRADGLFLYRNNRIMSLTKVGNYVGNPDLDPEKTVAYELGIEQQFSSDIKVTLTGYYKDVTNLLNWEKYVARSIQDRELNVYTNADYGNIKGMEVTFIKRPNQFWGGTVNYTWSVAKGRSSTPGGGSGSFTSAKRMNLLNFDQTHTINANLTLRTPEGFGFDVLGAQPLANWVANLQFAFGSGLPYSSYATKKVNDKRQPATTTTDLKLLRRFKYKRYGLNLFMDVYNVFNTKNVNWIGSSLYYEAGSAQDASIKNDPSVVRRAADGSYIRNPQAYSAGRQVRFGIGLNF